MNTPNDGGPAFPTTAEQSPSGQFPTPGMTLRDWFAGQALAGMLAHPDTTIDVDDVDPKELVGYMKSGPWLIADAMLEARKGGAS